MKMERTVDLRDSDMIIDIHIPAHTMILVNWFGPLLHRQRNRGDAFPWVRNPLVWANDELWSCEGTIDLCQWKVRDGCMKDLLLDLRRTEVIDQVSRVMTGSSGPRVIIHTNLNGEVEVDVWAGLCHIASSTITWTDRKTMYVPGLLAISTLLEEDQLPEAMKMCWQEWLKRHQMTNGVMG